MTPTQPTAASTAPATPVENPLAARLAAAVAIITAYQQREKISNAELIRRFDGLGSDKTLGILRRGVASGDFGDLKLDKWALSYESVANVIQDQGQQESDELYDDLPCVIALAEAFARTLNTTSNARLILFEGDSGIGKSCARQVIERQYRTRLLRVEASSAWDDNPNALLGAILRALGDQAPPSSRAAKLDKVLTLLAQPRRGLIIEEAHHLGPKCLNTVKTLINGTPGEVILICIPTLWRRLERDAYEEARQLTGNRLAERVKMPAPDTATVQHYLSKRTSIPRAELREFAKALAPIIPRFGNLAYLRQISRRALADAAGAPLTVDSLYQAHRAESGAR